MKHAKLWKRILHEGIRAGGDYLSEQTPGVIDRIITAPIIVGLPLNDSPVLFDNFKSLTVPFPLFWVECGAENDPEVRFGALVYSENNDDGDGFVVVADYYLAHTISPVYVGQDTYHLTGDGDMVWARYSDGMRVNPYGFVPNKHCSGSGNQAGILCFMDMLLSTMQMLGCKNVSLGPRDNDPKQVRIATKRHGPSDTGYRYHVLTVRPAGSNPGTPGQEIGNMPRHVCRGHFAEYGPQFGKGLLFGKYDGRFYVPPHMKGKAKNGTVLKDYKVSV